MTEIQGKAEHFNFMVKNLERLGISAVIIEDKKGLKKTHCLEKKFIKNRPIKSFCEKIMRGKKHNQQKILYNCKN